MELVEPVAAHTGAQTVTLRICATEKALALYGIDLLRDSRCDTQALATRDDAREPFATSLAHLEQLDGAVVLNLVGVPISSALFACDRRCIFHGFSSLFPRRCDLPY